MDYSMLILLGWNVLVMLIYGLDKLLAKMHSQRISEYTLLLCAFLLGGAGAIFGMVLFNHKTKKLKFRILVPTSIAVGAVAVFVYGLSLPF